MYAEPQKDAKPNAFDKIIVIIWNDGIVWLPLSPVSSNDDDDDDDNDIIVNDWLLLYSTPNVLGSRGSSSLLLNLE